MVRKWAIGIIIVVFLMVVLPVVQAETDHFSNSFILLLGKSNMVSSNALWIFGGKFLLNKKVTIQTNGEEGEKVSMLVLPPNFGLYLGHENILIQMESTTGFFFLGEKSFFLQKSSPRIAAFCKVRDIWITYT